ncbi:sugar transferase [Clostridium porci]|uniref:Sugar transferase n=1 Tax=Clostridium porci TaxID=2605778 RepID=A0A7X2NL08_9CLOT|nr:sugar transferase [Clostridium porci]MSS36810.1 sugar transferase [Clostridium porci]
MRNYEQYKRIIRFLTSIAILIVEIGIYWFAWNRYFSQVAGTPFFRKGDWLMAMVYGLLLLFFSRMYGGLKIGYLERGNVFYSQILSLILTSMFTYLQIALLAKHFLNIIPFLVMFVLQVIAVCIWIFLANFLFQKLFPPRQMLLIYGNRPSLTLMDKMNSRSDRYQIKNVIHIDAGLMKIEQMISSYDAIVICDVPSSIRNQLLKYCYGEGIRVYMTPKLSDILVRSAEDITLFDTPLIMARNGHISVEQAFFKRTMDIIIAGTACILASPFMLITAIAIKFQDGGPVIYKQKRLTFGGREFYVYKFRSMTMDAEQDGIARLACVNDNRITPVGAFIRKIRLDETPQLCNILKGDMSIVGPRPERPEIARQYEEEMPEFRYRLRVKAGLTGYAQIFGKYNTTPYDKLKLDLHYIQNYSLMMDVKLMIQTLKILFMRESTKGIAENQTTARLLPDTNEKE